MDNDDNQPHRTPSRSLLLDEARWPQDTPLSSTEIKLAQQHTVLGISRFIAYQALPQAYQQLFPGLIIPLAAWLLRRQRTLGAPLLVGISGAPGSGRRTLALALQLILRDSFAARTCALSLADFYLDQPERHALAAEVHSLLGKPGPLGTHDISLLCSTIDQLLEPATREVALPAFDEVQGRRMPRGQWPSGAANPEIIILEGWCLGARPQNENEIAQPINELERKADPRATLRHFMNQQLAEVYLPLFTRFHPLVFLDAPGWTTILRWQSKHDPKRPGKASRRGSGMDETLEADLDLYQRQVEAMKAQMPSQADVVLGINSLRQFSSLVLKLD